MKYHLRKSPTHPESHYLVTREEIDDQLRTGQIDNSWQARAEDDSAWRSVDSLTQPSAPQPASTAKSILVALILLAGFVAAGSLLASGDLDALFAIVGKEFQSREEIAQEALSNRIARESNGLIRLAGFEKTNGMDQEYMGVKVYEIEYVATVEATDDCLWSLGGNFWDGTFAATRGRARSGVEAFNPQVFGKNAAQKGQRMRVSGKMALQKAEKGWRIAQ